MPEAAVQAALADDYKRMLEDVFLECDLVRALSLVNATPGKASWAGFETRALDPALRHPAWSTGFGSLALAEAGIGLPFDQIVVSIAPWLVPRAVTLRGGIRATPRWPLNSSTLSFRWMGAVRPT